MAFRLTMTSDANAAHRLINGYGLLHYRYISLVNRRPYFYALISDFSTILRQADTSSRSTPVFCYATRIDFFVK